MVKKQKSELAKLQATCEQQVRDTGHQQTFAPVCVCVCVRVCVCV